MTDTKSGWWYFWHLFERTVGLVALWYIWVSCGDVNEPARNLALFFVTGTAWELGYTELQEYRHARKQKERAP